MQNCFLVHIQYVTVFLYKQAYISLLRYAFSFVVIYVIMPFIVFW